MRPATWRLIETTPLLQRIYRAYSHLPAPLRSPLRVFASPLWSGAANLVLLRANERVVSGPFQGLALELAPVSRRHLLSYVLGTTELELRAVMERIVTRNYATILNIGAADGYYAVGLARRSPRSRIVAFEAKADLHPALQRVARRNGVAERIAVHGLCSAEALREQLETASGPVLALVDIEGAERELLAPAQVPELRGVDLLVETHDVYAPGCTEALVARFSPTHTIERYRARPRVLADFPDGFLPLLPRLLPKLAVDLMDERRAGTQEWLYMTARTPDAAGTGTGRGTGG